MSIPLFFQPMHVESIPVKPANDKSWKEVEFDAVACGLPTEVRPELSLLGGLALGGWRRGGGPY